MFFIFNNTCIKNMDESKRWTSFCDHICIRDLTCDMKLQTRDSQEPVIPHLVFNLTSKVDRNGECYT